mgnify:CR=1 FL=1
MVQAWLAHECLQELINQTTSFEVPLVDEVLAVLLLGSLPSSWETLVVILGDGEI